MRRLMILAACVVLSFSAISQEKESLGPDYAAIEKMTKDPNSIFFYPNLFTRYNKSDTSLSLREYKMLYYGSFFRDDYTVIVNTKIDDQLNELFSKDTLSKEDWMHVVALCQQYLQKKPFELKKLNLVYFAYKNIGDQLQQRYYADKIKKIAYAILSSGDGLSEKSALHVVQLSDEYSIIHMLGYEQTGQKELRGDRCDYLELKENSEHIAGLYFDLKQLFIEYQKVLDGTAAGK